jgi:RimJ/RimL family protein N-acetyltransferase
MNPKVYLTPIKTEHIRIFIRLSEDPVLVRTMGWKPFKPNQTQLFVDAVSKPSLPLILPGDAIIYSIMKTNDDVPIGFLSLKGIDWDSARAELAIAICDDRYRSDGYGSEALSLALDHAFTRLELASIYLSVFPSNRRAIRAYEKNGFKLVERLENSWKMPNGEKVDMLVMSIEQELND